jgi:hypothetical protein
MLASNNGTLSTIDDFSTLLQVLSVVKTMFLPGKWLGFNAILEVEAPGSSSPAATEVEGVIPNLFSRASSLASCAPAAAHLRAGSPSRYSANLR